MGMLSYIVILLLLHITFMMAMLSYIVIASYYCNDEDVFSVQKKPVIQLKAASAINRIMVLCDSTLSLLNMLNLEVWRN